MTPRQIYLQLLVFFSVFACSYNASATTLEQEGISLNLSKHWGKPVYRNNTSTCKTSEWRYTRKHATLYIIKAECSTCRPFTQQDVDNINKYPELKTTAILTQVNSTPALYSVTISDKNVNLRNIKINHNGYQYELQLGVSGKADFNTGFQLEKEFINIVSGLSLR